MVASFGLVLYMFLMGLELDTGLLFRGIKRFTVISLAEPEKRELTPFPSFLLFTFVALAITAFPVLARILTEKKLLSTPVGLMTISAAAIDDICAWVLLALAISIINAGDPFVAAYVLITIAIYALFLLVPGRILLRKAFEKFFTVNRNPVLTQMLLAITLIMVFLSAWTTEWIGVHAIFGAFLVGIIIPRIGGLTMELTHKLEDLVGIAFLPLYFASSGLKTKMGLLNDWTTLLFSVLVICVACAGKIIGCTLAARWTGFPWRESFSIGILMNTKGLVELIVLNIGLDAGVINERIFVVMVLMALVTTFMTSPLVAFVYPPKYQNRTVSLTKKKKSHPSGLLFKEDIDEEVLLYLTELDSVPLVANFLQMFRASLPQKNFFLLGFKAFTEFDRSSNIMVSTQTERVIESDQTLSMFRFFGKLMGVKTKSFIAATRLAEIGVEINRIAEKEQCDLLVVPWKKDSPGSDQRAAVSSIISDVKSMNIAIFVDRVGTTISLGNHHHPFHRVVVLFTRGENSRAALQLAFRLRRRQTEVRLTVLHLQITNASISSLDNELLQAVKELSAKESGVFLSTVKCVDREEFKPVLEKTLANGQGSFDLALVGHSFVDFDSMTANGSSSNAEAGTAVQKRPSLIRRFSQRIATDEDRIFGAMGEWLYEFENGPSFVVVHAMTNLKASSAA
uniref:Cation/H+ exchanger domain-containing protein n=1 Tax=Ditylenchus dipsaci TaxID=166011 RepID=A0A915CKE2_9BILA